MNIKLEYNWSKVKIRIVERKTTQSGDFRKSQIVHPLFRNQLLNYQLVCILAEGKRDLQVVNIPETNSFNPGFIEMDYTLNGKNMHLDLQQFRF